MIISLRLTTQHAADKKVDKKNPTPSIMERLGTPNPDGNDYTGQYPTPTKAKVQGAIEFCKKMKIPYFKEDVFRTFGVGHHAGWRIVREDERLRRLHDNSDLIETRGRHSFISPQKFREMERILEEGFEARALTWEQLGYEAGLDCSGRTVQRAMGTMDYHKCVACRKEWVNQRQHVGESNGPQLC